MEASETELMMKGYGLTTAEVYYRMSDYRSVINIFVWQARDLVPDYSELLRFIEFSQQGLDGPLHSVRFPHRTLISRGDWRHVMKVVRLH